MSDESGATGGRGSTDDRRAQLTAALARLLPERGWAKTSTAAIAAEAGLTTGLVHYHFKRKLDILIQLLADMEQALEERRARRASAGDPPEVQLRALVDAHLALGDDATPGFVACWVAVAAEAVHHPEVGPLYRGVLERRTEEIAGFLVQMGVVEDEARRRAGLATAGIEGAFLVAATAPGVVVAGSAAAGVWGGLVGPS